MNEDKETVIYSNHQNIHFKFIHESDGWWSIYKLNVVGRYIPLLQSKDLEHCKSYVEMIEEPGAPVLRLC